MKPIQFRGVKMEHLRGRANRAEQLDRHLRLHGPHVYWTFALEVRRKVGRPALESRTGAEHTPTLRADSFDRDPRLHRT